MEQGRWIAVLVVGTVITGYGGIFGGALAHPVSDHNPDIPAPVTRTFEGPPIEGPGDPDGQEGPAPYVFQAIILNNACVGPDAAGLGGEPLVCATNGGSIWHACDGGGHELVGGDPALDLPCSVPDDWSGDPVPGDLPYDRLDVTIRAGHPTTDEIPAIVATENGDPGILYGEGHGGDASNDGDCEQYEQDVGPVTIGTGLGCNDAGPGPKEIEHGICTTAQNLRRPSKNDLHGSGDGVIQQALSGETYRTHNLGPDKTAFDPPEDQPIGHHDPDTSLVELTEEGHPHDVELNHPGVIGLAVFIQGPVHGPKSCGDYQRLGDAFRGEVRVQLS